MANVFFVKEGTEESRLVPQNDVNIEQILEVFTQDRLHHVGGNIPSVGTDRDDFTPYRDTIYVYIKISNNEGNQAGLSEGYYFVKDVKPSDWDKRFK